MPLLLLLLLLDTAINNVVSVATVTTVELRTRDLIDRTILNPRIIENRKWPSFQNTMAGTTGSWSVQETRTQKTGSQLLPPVVSTVEQTWNLMDNSDSSLISIVVPTLNVVASSSQMFNPNGICANLTEIASRSEQQPKYLPQLQTQQLNIRGRVSSFEVAGNANTPTLEWWVNYVSVSDDGWIPRYNSSLIRFSNFVLESVELNSCNMSPYLEDDGMDTHLFGNKNDVREIKTLLTTVVPPTCISPDIKIRECWVSSVKEDMPPTLACTHCSSLECIFS